jgi:hypothetical protein
MAIPEVRTKFEAGDISDQTGPELTSDIRAQIERLQGWSKPWVSRLISHSRLSYFS